MFNKIKLKIGGLQWLSSVTLTTITLTLPVVASASYWDDMRIEAGQTIKQAAELGQRTTRTDLNDVDIGNIESGAIVMKHQGDIVVLANSRVDGGIRLHSIPWLFRPTSVYNVAPRRIVIESHAVVDHLESHRNVTIQAGEGVEIGDILLMDSSTIELGRGSRVRGSIITGVRDGTMFCLGEGADVAGTLISDHGTILLDGAHIGGGIQTKGGHIEVRANSRVEGGITSGQRHWFGLSDYDKMHLPKVVIGPHAVVQGPLNFHNVVLLVSESAQIGPVTGATPVWFSGDTLPTTADADGRSTCIDGKISDYRYWRQKKK